MKSLFRGAFFRGASVSLLALGVAACTDNPQALNRPGDVPPAFTAPSDQTAPIWPKAGWWANFGSDELTPLEQTAQKENLDIAQAAAAVLQAEANDGVALSALFPSLGGNIGVTRSGSNTPSRTTGLRATTAFTAGLTASYEQNFFGQQFFQLQAARENLRFSRYAAAV